MKNFSAAAFAAIALVTFALPVHAETEQERCSAIGDLAESIMSARQAGAVMSKAMEAVKDSNPLKQLTRELIIAAYERPQFSVEENQRDAAIEFRNDAELMCYKAT